MKLPDGTDFRKTVKYTMGITGVEVETMDAKVAEERRDWPAAEARAKEKGFRRPFWHTARDFYKAMADRLWDDLSPKQQSMAISISKALGAQPILLPFPSTTATGSVGPKVVSRTTGGGLEDLMKRARTVHKEQVKRKPPLSASKGEEPIKPRKPKWSWTKTG